jgi:Fe-S-cluster containining protein
MLFRDKLAQLSQKNPPSSETGESSCNRCGLCCWRRPPRLTQDELKRIAAHIGKTDSEFFQEFCVVDDPACNPMPVPVLRREHQHYLAGEYLPADETYSIESPCVFLDTENGNACKLNDCKPQECAGFKCWEDGHKSLVYSWTRDELSALGYLGEPEDWRDD